jgi:hypothetical protein
MSSEHVENALKKELIRIDKKLKRAEARQLAALIASAAVVGWALASAASHIPLLAAMAAAGVLLNVMATRVVSRKKQIIPLTNQRNALLNAEYVEPMPLPSPAVRLMPSQPSIGPRRPLVSSPDHGISRRRRFLHLKSL